MFDLVKRIDFAKALTGYKEDSETSAVTTTDGTFNRERWLSL